jgi:hypothetical protein
LPESTPDRVKRRLGLAGIRASATAFCVTVRRLAGMVGNE